MLLIYEIFTRARGNRQKNFIENGCLTSFFLVLFTKQKTLIIITVGLPQLIEIERSPAVLSGREAVLLKKFY